MEGYHSEEDSISMAPPYLFYTEKPSNWDSFFESLHSNNSQLGNSIKLQKANKRKLILCCKNDGLTLLKLAVVPDVAHDF
jgi:hypothetical protein